MAYGFQVAQIFEAISLQDLWLPFALIFVVMFAAMQKTHILGSGPEARKYNMAISLIIGLLVVIPHLLGKYPKGSDPVLIMNNAIPNVAVAAIAIVMFLVLLGVFGGGKTNWTSGWTGLIVLVSAGFVIWIFLASAGY